MSTIICHGNKPAVPSSITMQFQHGKRSPIVGGGLPSEELKADHTTVFTRDAPNLLNGFSDLTVQRLCMSCMHVHFSWVSLLVK